MEELEELKQKLDQLMTENQKLQQEKNSLLSKRDELLEKTVNYKTFQEQVESLGGLDTFKQLHETYTKSKESENDVEHIKSHYAKLLEDEKSKREQLANKYTNEKTQQLLERAIEAKGGNPKLLSPIIRDRIVAQLQDGEFKVEVLDETRKNKKYVGDREASIEDLIDELATSTDYAPAFVQNAKSGSGQKPGLQTPTETFSVKIGEKGNIEKLTELYKKNPERAKHLLEQAHKR